jgi:outer membrane protein assembly factor BamB
MLAELLERGGLAALSSPALGVVPVLVGPLQVLLALLPAIIIALAGVALSVLRPRAVAAGVVLLWRLKLPLAALGAVAAGLLWLLGRPPAEAPAGVADGAGGAPRGAAGGSGAAEWRLFRGGLARRGVAGDLSEPGPDAGGVRWRFRREREEILSSPAVSGSRVYAATAVPSAFGDGEGSIVCLDADTGALLWEAAPEGYRPTFSSPVIAGDYLVCGEGLHTTEDARVICLDLRTGREGQVVWTFRTRSHVECTPVVAEGRVYVGAGDDGYYALDLEPDASGSARLVWHRSGEEYPDAETALAVHEGKVYCGLGVGGQALCALDAASGAEIARLPAPYPIFSPPAIADGRLYVGMGHGDYVKSAEEVRLETIARLEAEGRSAEEIRAAAEAIRPGGEVWCVSLDDFRLRWRFPVERAVLGSVAVVGGSLYFGARDGRVYRLDLDGKLETTWSSFAPIVASPAVSARHVYVVNAGGAIHALERESLEPVWEERLLGEGSEALCVSSPAVARGRVYVGTGEGLIALGSTREAGPPFWSGRLGGPGAGGNPEGRALPSRGAVRWQFPAGADDAGPAAAGAAGAADEARAAAAGEPLLITAPPAVAGGRLYVPLAGRKLRGVAAIAESAAEPPGGAASAPGAPEPRAPAPGAPEPEWLHATENPVYLSPAVAGGLVLAVDGSPEDGGRHLHALDATDGTPRWRSPVARGASGAFSALPDRVLIQHLPGALSAVDLRGARLWSRALGSVEHAPAAAGAIALVAVSEPPSLAALDRDTGRELWRAPLGAPPRAAPWARRDAIVIATGRGIEARSLVDGSPQADWRLEGGPAAGDFALLEDAIAYLNEDRELVLVARADGRLLRRLPGADAGAAPVPSAGRLLFAAAGGIAALDLADPASSPRPWADLGALGPPAQPFVVGGSRLYVALRGGLASLGAP